MGQAVCVGVGVGDCVWVWLKSAYLEVLEKRTVASFLIYSEKTGRNYGENDIVAIIRSHKT